jgi:hypothetical protein
MIDPLTIAAVSAGGSLLKGFFGSRDSKRAEAAARAGLKQGLTAYNTGSDEAGRNINTGANTARAMYQPYVQTGARADKQYSNALGVNGRRAQAAFFSSFQNDPGYQATLDAGRDQIEHSAVVRGGANSGATMKELFGFGQRQQQSQFQDRLDRLSGLGTRGFQATGARADIETGRYASLADLALKKGKFGSDIAINRGQVKADGIGQRSAIRNGMFDDVVSAFGSYAGQK